MLQVAAMPKRVSGADRLVLEEAIVDPEHEKRWMEYCNRHRCDSQSRGSVYDSKAGRPQPRSSFVLLFLGSCSPTGCAMLAQPTLTVKYSRWQSGA